MLADEILAHEARLVSGDIRGIPVLLPTEVAVLFRVHKATVARWVGEGRIPPEAVFRTPGENIRFFEVYIKRILVSENLATEVACEGMIWAAKELAAEAWNAKQEVRYGRAAS